MSHAPAGGPLSDRRALCDDQFDRSSLVAVRKNVAACAAAQGLQDLPLSRFTVAVHEIVLNAVRHGGGRGRLRLWRTADTLHCLVSDDGPGIADRHRGLRPQPSGAGAGQTSYGLWLVGQLCPHVRITDRADRGTDVLLEFPLHADHASPSRPGDVGPGAAGPSAP
jgi:anti-sigma regulatory factor (Ser/Thr protein kinase)